MHGHRQTRTLLFAITLVIWTAPPMALGQWYAGTWDSRIHNLIERPRTVAVRAEVVDAETHLPLSGVTVSIRGQWIEQRVGRAHGDEEAAKPGAFDPQEREYRLDATTGPDGVAVFALGWHKEYPWRQYFGEHPPREPARTGGGYTVKNSWIRAVDDIEKAQQIEFRHPRYNFFEVRLPFERYLDVGQDNSEPWQEPHFFDRFERAWQSFAARADVVYFVLNLGTTFPDFENPASTRPEFFEKVRAKDWGRQIRTPENRFTRGDHPQSLCGPYFCLLYEVRLDRRAGQIDVHLRRSDVSPVEDRASIDSSADPPPALFTQHPSAEDGSMTVLKAEFEKLRSLSLLSRQEISNERKTVVEFQERLESKFGTKGFGDMQTDELFALLTLDPNTKQITTLGAYMGRLLKSLGDDVLPWMLEIMLLDSTFLVDEAQIIRLDDGRYVSLTEAIGVAAARPDSGLDPELLARVLTAATTVYQSWRLGEAELLGKALTSFPFAVSHLNAVGVGPRLPREPSALHDEDFYSPELAMTLRTLTPELRKEFGLYIGVEGAVIVRVDPDAPAGHRNLGPGMVVFSCDNRAISDADTLAQRAKELVATPAAAGASVLEPILLGIWRWNGFTWGRDHAVISVMGNKAGYALAEQASGKGVQSSLEREKTIDIGNGVKMEFVLIPAGSFYMGYLPFDKDTSDDEVLVRRVRITRPFYLGKFEVTQDQYVAIMGTNPSRHSGPDIPVHGVSWNDALEFCRRLSLQVGPGFRLPTEAEWEYACRAGTHSRFSFGDDPSAFTDYAWTWKDDMEPRPHPVGQKRPNAWGLFDMHSNVFEWCQDWYADSSWQASKTLVTDPRGPSSGTRRVFRGGDVWHPYYPSAGRMAGAPDYRPRVSSIGYLIGFRVALDLNGDKKSASGAMMRTPTGAETRELNDALLLAASKGDLDQVRNLIEIDGADVDANHVTDSQKPSLRHTPLMAAAFKGHLDVVRYLIQKGAHVNADDGSGINTPLTQACKSGSLAVVKLLVQSGANIRQRNRWGQVAVERTLSMFPNEEIQAFLAEAASNDGMRKGAGSGATGTKQQ